MAAILRLTTGVVYLRSVSGSFSVSSGALTLLRDGIGVTSTDGVVLDNDTAAAAGAQQMSPRLRFDGFGWKTDATAASQAVSVINELLPVQGASAPTANLLWKYAVNGGAYSTIATLTSAGALTTASSITTSAGNITSGAALVATSSIEAGGTGAIYWSARSVLESPANAQFTLRNFGNTAGFGLDVSTNAVAKFRTTAQNAYATVDALAFQTSGNALNYTVSAYAVGTAYALTNSAAAIDVGTTDPAIVLDKAGTYRIEGQVNLAYTGATVATETATIKVRRTNNTAADLSAVVVLDLPVSTVLTNTYGIFVIPPFDYTTTAVDDAITLFANVSAALSAGTIDVTAIGTSIVATRIS